MKKKLSIILALAILASCSNLKVKNKNKKSLDENSLSSNPKLEVPPIISLPVPQATKEKGVNIK